MAAAVDTDFIQDQMQAIDAARAVALPDADALPVFRDYARGIQKRAFTDGQARILRNLLAHLYSDNICRMVLAALVNRLHLTGFDVPDERVQAYIETVWTLNRLPTLAASTHWAALRDRDAAIGLAWDSARRRVVLSREAFWNGTQGLFIAYDETDNPAYAVKEWPVVRGWRRTVYYPGRIERYAREHVSDDWAPYVGAADTGWPMPWVDRDGAPLNPPFVHFANLQVPADGRGDGEEADPDSRYGTSELDGGILGLQDAINDIHWDILAAARFAGFGMYALTGFPPLTDAAGNEIAWTAEPGAVWRSSDPAARVQTIQPGSLSELREALAIELQAVARATGVPMHFISGEWPSGVALLQSQMSLLEKVDAIARSFGPSWASVMHKATRLANTFARQGLDEDAPIEARFIAAANRDPLTTAEIATATAPYVSRAETLRLLGYNQPEIERILAEIDDDTRRSPTGAREIAEAERTRAVVEAERRAMMPGGDTDLAARLAAAGEEQEDANG